MRAEYLKPLLELEEVAVEFGFTVSGDGDIDNAPSDKWGDY